MEQTPIDYRTLYELNRDKLETYEREISDLRVVCTALDLSLTELRQKKEKPKNGLKVGGYFKSSNLRKTHNLPQPLHHFVSNNFRSNYLTEMLGELRAMEIDEVDNCIDSFICAG